MKMQDLPDGKDLDEETRAALAALKRARRRAEELAARTGTFLIEVLEGKVVRVPPPAPGPRL